MPEADYDPEIRTKLVEYLSATVPSDCVRHIDESYIFGSLASGRFANPSDVDVFFVMDEWEHPGKVDINMTCMANVPEAVEQGLGRQRDEWWSGRAEWGMRPEEVIEEIPEYVVEMFRAIIAEPFRTACSQRWVDVYVGTRSQLDAYANETEQLPFPDR